MMQEFIDRVVRLAIQADKRSIFGVERIIWHEPESAADNPEGKFIVVYKRSNSSSTES